MSFGQTNTFRPRPLRRLITSEPILSGTSTGSTPSVLEQSSTTSVQKDAAGKAVTGGNFSTPDKMSDQTLYSTAVGSEALADPALTGVKNTAVGKWTMAETTTGQKNSGYGYKTMWHNTTGNDNAAFGYETLQDNTTGSGNVAMGKEALEKHQSPEMTTAIGYKAGNTLEGEGRNQILIGANAQSKGDNTTVIGNADTESVFLHGNQLTLQGATDSASLSIQDLQQAKDVAGEGDVFYYHMGEKASSRPQNTLEHSLKYTGKQPYDGVGGWYSGPASFSSAYDAHGAKAWSGGQNEGAANSVHYLGRYLPDKRRGGNRFLKEVLTLKIGDDTIVSEATYEHGGGTATYTEIPMQDFEVVSVTPGSKQENVHTIRVHYHNPTADSPYRWRSMTLLRSAEELEPAAETRAPVFYHMGALPVGRRINEHEHSLKFEGVVSSQPSPAGFTAMYDAPDNLNGGASSNKITYFGYYLPGGDQNYLREEILMRVDGSTIVASATYKHGGGTATYTEIPMQDFHVVSVSPPTSALRNVKRLRVSYNNPSLHGIDGYRWRRIDFLMEQPAVASTDDQLESIYYYPSTEQVGRPTNSRRRSLKWTGIYDAGTPYTGPSGFTSTMDAYDATAWAGTSAPQMTLTGSTQPLNSITYMGEYIPLRGANRPVYMRETMHLRLGNDTIVAKAMYKHGADSTITSSVKEDFAVLSVNSGSRYADVKTLRIVYHNEDPTRRWREVQFLTTHTTQALTLSEGLDHETLTMSDLSSLKSMLTHTHMITLDGDDHAHTQTASDRNATAKDLVVWYTTADTLSNFDNSTPPKPYISTYSTYRKLYDTDGAARRRAGVDKSAVPALVNSGINFSETYVENGGGQENYSIFTINVGYKSVTGSAYGLANAQGYWPPGAVVLSTIPNKGNFAGSASSEAQMPYNHIRITTYPDGWRRVHLSVNEISKSAEPSADLTDPNTLAE